MGKTYKDRNNHQRNDGRKAQIAFKQRKKSYSDNRYESDSWDNTVHEYDDVRYYDRPDNYDYYGLE